MLIIYFKFHQIFHKGLDSLDRKELYLRVIHINIHLFINKLLIKNYLAIKNQLPVYSLFLL